MALVFFDLDGTLLQGESSERQFIKYLFKKKYLRLPQLLAALKFFILKSYDLKSEVFKKNKAYLSGLSVAKIHLLAEDFVNNYLRYKLRESLVKKLHCHQNAGDTVILLTGTPYFIADPLAKLLKFNYSIGTLIKETNGFYCAEVPLQHPFGQEKLIIAARLCSELNAELCHCIAYADSVYDLPLLSKVGKAVIVAPDPKCEIFGKKQGWDLIEK
jgi:HAD superfamily hydrolase (TIGR01490 family)